MTITIASPIVKNGETLGVFGLDIIIEDLSEMMRNYKIGENGYAALAYSDGQVLYHPDYDTTNPSGTIYIKDVLSDVPEELLSGKRGITSIEYKGVEKYVAFFPIKDTDLIVYTIIPKAETLSKLNGFIIMNTVILAVLIIILSFFMFFLKNLISAPVVKISEEIESFSKNQKLSLPKKFLHRKDEVGTLSRGLDFMSREISKHLLEIEEKNHALTAAKEKISRERVLFQTTIYSLSDGVVATDRFGKISIMNDAAEHISGWILKDAKGKDINEVLKIVYEFRKDKNACTVEEVLKIGRVTAFEENAYLVSRTGEEIPIEGSVAPIKDGMNTITGAVIVFRDFAEKKEKQEQILYLSYHDQLTGLYNRRFFEEELKRVDTERSLPLSVAMVDVNGLKLTNDAFGHKIGDELLVKVAKILKSECRSSDIVARVGGDEFFILLPNTPGTATEQIIERIYKAAANEKLNNIVISISIGFDTKTSKETPVETVLIKAEQDMYRKKITESQSMRNRTIQIILETLNKKNEREKLHAERVSRLCKDIGEKMNFDEETVNDIEHAGLLYDIGKITLPDHLLDKRGKLTAHEFEEMQRHTESGYLILKAVDAYTSLAEDALSHHERWDGKGYPRGQKGEEIPLIARIISVADAYEAMTSNRPYKDALSEEEAINELLKNSGTQFDPDIVEVFVEKVLNFLKKDFGL